MRRAGPFDDVQDRAPALPLLAGEERLAQRPVEAEELGAEQGLDGESHDLGGRLRAEERVSSSSEA